MTGLPPFQSQSEFLIFKKIEKLDYSFHEGFNEVSNVKTHCSLLLALLQVFQGLSNTVCG
jgi:hypothetical protein